MRKTTFTAMGAVIGALALALTACSGDASSTSAADGDAGALNIGEFADVTSWDPSLADIGFDGPYLSAVYDPLLAVDGDGNPTAALATDWTVSDDYLTITMNLRTGVTFSDGEVFDADAAVKSLEYLQAGTRSGEAYTNVSSFEAVDDDTIEIHLTQRDDTILYFMGLGRSYMMAPDSIDAGTLATDPVGSGPYILDATTTVAGSEYHFTKVDDHWDAEEFPWSELSIYPIQDDTARLNAMLSGQINVSYADQQSIDQADANGWNVAGKVSGWVGLQFTDRTGSSFAPLGSTEVRQALNYAFDGASILDAIGSGQGVATNQVFPSGMTGNLDDLNDLYATDIDTAKELLAEAGYADGFSVTMPMTPVFSVWQPSVEQVFSELGITVTWDDMQYTDYQANAATYPMFIAYLSMDSNAVANVERQIALAQWYNPTPEIDQFADVQAAVDAVYAADPGDAQDQAIEDLNTLVTELAWFDVWYQANNTYVSTSDIEVTPVTGMMYPTLRQITTAG
ncbi:MAG: ABC transporter substrate-binding protein [Microbacterium sp.]